ncbi:hypothetical protein DFH08DRAFT_621637, partial [Mycena albidolilacea]
RTEKIRDWWARAMLISFKPWQTIQDLKDVGEKWGTVYEHTQIISNMQVEHECKDTRDAYKALQK